MNIIEGLKKHWFGSSVVLAVACIGVAWAVFDALYVKPRDLIINERDLTINEKKELISQLQKEVQDLEARLASSKEAELREEIRNLKAQLANVGDLKTQLANSDKQVGDLKTQLANLNKEIKKEKEKAMYVNIFCASSPYPLVTKNVKIGDNVSVAQSILGGQLRESSLSVDYSSGPFRWALFSHNGAGNDPKISGMVFQFRDDNAREAVRKEALCAFGDDSVVRSVQDQILTWTNLRGFNIKIDQDSYEIHKVD